VRDFLRSVLVGACALPVVVLAALPATASDAGPQRSATPNVTAEIGYARAQVHPGDQDTMTVSLINHGPQSLDDHTSVHITVTMPQDADVSPNVVETIPGNAPSGSSNAVPSTRSVPLTQVFVRSAPGFFDVVVPAGSFGDSTSFRTYAFTLQISPNAPQGTQLVGGGVAVALENYVGLTVEKSIVPPPPIVVVPPKTPTKSHKSGGTGGKSGGKSGGSSGSGSWSGGGSSEWIQRGSVVICMGGSGAASGNGGNAGSGSGGSGGSGSGGMGQCSCPVDSHMSSSSGGAGGSKCACPVDSHMSAGGGGSSGSGCGCPIDSHMSVPSGSAGGGKNSAGVQCTAATGRLAATGSPATWPLALALLALAAGAALMRVASGRNWSRP
jgi:uncharacterized membrane protein YgcG